MKTALDANFLRAVVLCVGFKPDATIKAQAALLLMAMTENQFTAAQMPAEITHGNKHLAGVATGALISVGLIRVVGRVKSPNKDANGRKVNLLELEPGKLATARAWLKANGISEPEQPTPQLALL